MESDSIRADATMVNVDIWIDGKVRSVAIAREAIGAIVGYEKVAALTDEQRSELVRGNLPLFVKAAKERLKHSDPDSETLVIHGPAVAAAGGANATDRRKIERRKAERRKVATPREKLAGGERRRSDRRQCDRRSRLKPTGG